MKKLFEFFRSLGTFQLSLIITVLFLALGFLYARAEFKGLIKSVIGFFFLLQFLLMGTLFIVRREIPIYFNRALFTGDLAALLGWIYLIVGFIIIALYTSGVAI